MSLIKKYIPLAIVFLLIGCSKPDTYQIEMISVSEQGLGVIVTKIIAHKKPKVFSEVAMDTIFVHPMIPSEHTNITSLKNLKEIPHHKLPNYITFEYQYAQLSDCSSIHKDKVLKIRFLQDYSPIEKGDIVEMNSLSINRLIKNNIATLAKNPNIINIREDPLKRLKKELAIAPTYYTKYKCKDWKPIDSMKFTKTINLEPYKKRKEIKRFRKKHDGVSGSYYTTKIRYQFYDNGEIKLNLQNSHTNPWK